MKLVTYPAKGLREKTAPVTHFDDSLALAASQMRRLMAEENGAGLAAPQVGIPQAFFVASPGLMPHEVVINPTWVQAPDSSQYMAEEGCLSFPGLFLRIKRFDKIDVQYQDIGGKMHSERLEGFAAHVFQHESDHLVGTLMIDHL